MSLWICEPCYLHDRATVAWSDEQPVEPCAHAGAGPDDCKRIGWVRRSWFCLSCKVIGFTTIVYSDVAPRAGCEQSPNHDSWVETELSRWVRARRSITDEDLRERLGDEHERRTA